MLDICLALDRSKCLVDGLRFACFVLILCLHVACMFVGGMMWAAEIAMLFLLGPDHSAEGCFCMSLCVCIISLHAWPYMNRLPFWHGKQKRGVALVWWVWPGVGLLRDEIPVGTFSAVPKALNSGFERTG